MDCPADATPPVKGTVSGQASATGGKTPKKGQTPRLKCWVDAVDGVDATG